MAQVRVFRVAGGSLAEIPAAHIMDVRWVDNLSAQPEATVRLSPAAELTPESTPFRIVIVPSNRQDLMVPIYGPYEMTSYAWDGAGYAIRGAIGVNFAARFATDDNAALDAIIDQVETFSSSGFEPFAGWATEPTGDTNPNVAHLGIDFITNLIRSALFNVSNLSDLDSLLANFGLVAYMTTEWPASGADVMESLTIRPIHPLRAGTDTYFIQPRIGAVSGWANGIPNAFVNPSFAMPATTEVRGFANIEQFPQVRVPDLFNSLLSGNKPTYLNRRINIGYRILGIEEEVVLFHTGSFNPPIYRIPQVVNLGGSAKMEEEIQRWNLQNSAADLTLRRFPGDSWADLREQFFVPHQIAGFPEQVFPKGWHDGERNFVIREVSHEYSATQGYSQEIRATLWQGPFRRLLAQTEED